MWPPARLPFLLWADFNIYFVCDTLDISSLSLDILESTPDQPPVGTAADRVIC